MSNNYARPLANNLLAKSFLINVLGLPNNSDTGTKAMLISEAETLLASENYRSTLHYVDNRHPSYGSEESRQFLREKIFQELVLQERLASDDDIALGKGGAMPPGCKPSAAKQVFFLTGLPASGKSTVASKIADHFNAVIVDSDYAKRKFPEADRPYSASVLHDESTRVVFGDADSTKLGELCLLEFCLAEGYNMVIPKIGHNPASIETLRDALITKGYEAHLTLVSLDRKEATKRALGRFLSTGRYVPLSLIFDGYSNDPILSYYRMKERAGWKSVGKISTSVGSSPRVVEMTTTNPAELFA